MAPTKQKSPTKPDLPTPSDALDAAPDVFAPEATPVSDLPTSDPIASDTAAFEAASDATTPVAAAFEAPASVVEAVEQTLHLAKETQDMVTDTARETAELVEDSVATASEGLSAFGRKAFENTRANAQAYLDHVTDLLAVRSVPEAFELNASFARKFAETLSVQAREFGELAQKSATEAAGSLKSRFGQPFKLVA